MDNQSTSRKPKGRLVPLIIILTVAIFLQLVTISEAVPEHAKFVYDAQLMIIVPCPQAGQPAFFPIKGKFDNTEESIESVWDGVITWAELRKAEGPLSSFGLPEGEGWDDFALSGNPVPIWRTVILSPESRWDQEGHWRY